MVGFDQASEFGVINAVLPQTINSTTPVVGDIIDTLGYNSITFVLQCGTFTTGSFVISLEEGNDSGLSDTGVPDSALIVGGTVAGCVVAAAKATKKVGYVGHKRYVRATITGSATPNAIVGAMAILGNPSDGPVAQ